MKYTTIFNRSLHQRGFTLIEALLVLGLAAVVAAIALGVYGSSRGGIKADDQATKTIALVSDVQKNWRNAGSYATLTGAEINKLSLIQPPMKFDGTNIVDAWGNVMKITGGPTAFALTIGGTTSAIGKDDCATVANGLASGVATNISIGSAATAGSGATAGQVTGGNAFKVGTTINQTSLTTGCNEPNTVIAASFP